MSIVEGPKSAGLFARVQGILLKPALEWDIIDREPATVPGLFTGYAAILAAIPPVALVLQHVVFIHWALPVIIVIAVLSYISSLIGVLIVGYIIDALAPSFDGQKNLVQAMKVAVYPFTAAWVAGILNIVPVLGILAILAALYGLYILYLGLPKLMKAPQEKATGYFVVTLVVAFVVQLIIGAVIASITAMMMMGAIAGGVGALGGLSGHTANLARLEAASQQMAAASQQMSNAAQTASTNAKSGPAIDAEKLKALLPESVAGLPRTEISATGMGSTGAGASNAEAVYSRDNARITLSVTDLAVASPLAAMAGAFNVNSDKETATGYEKTATINGRMTVENWDRSSKSGEYSIIVASRFAVKAEGNADSIDTLKSAVAAIGPDRLEGMAKG